ncbi:putative toxin-antitoxin system toxin component, PIN family [Myxococcota bacterium]|nr:putative toxin-antitoxin system toxin component, PIN family [Myxococcota bacterium]
MIRVVADTNIVVSAILWGGNPRVVLDAARRRTIGLFTSAALIAELEDVLSRAKFSERIARVESSVEEMVGDYLELAELVRPTEYPVVVRDPDDDQVIACAIAADARIIVTSDSDLLAIGRYRGVEIVTAMGALRQLSIS